MSDERPEFINEMTDFWKIVLEFRQCQKCIDKVPEYLGHWSRDS